MRQSSNQPISRRSFLAAGSALALAACGGGSSTSTSTETAVDLFESTDPAYLQAAFPAGNRQPTILSTGTTQRAIFGLTRGTGYLQADDVPATLDLVLTDPNGATVDVVLPRHAEQIPRHYYPLVFAPEIAGGWRVSGTFEGEDLLVDFTVAEPSEVDLIKLGEPMRSVATPTMTDARGVDPVCTRAPDPCPFHERSLDELVGVAPVALMVSTPAFCQTGICGPTLELLIASAEEFSDVEIIHAEVYTDPTKLGELPPPELLSETVQTYAMPFEPALIVANAAGIVTARLDVTMDAAEIRSALASATA